MRGRKRADWQQQNGDPNPVTQTLKKVPLWSTVGGHRDSGGLEKEGKESDTPLLLYLSPPSSEGKNEKGVLEQKKKTVLEC